jgi:LTXXQ motif family protein
MRSLPLIAVLLLSSTAYAQSPYAGMQTRGIKALSDSQIGDLQAGRGMGLALPAELNGYPGPLHVLELAEQLGLSAEQRGKVQQLFDAMKAEAISVGARLIEQEAELDRQFSGKSITPETLKSITAQIAATQGELRETHLKFHLSTASLLNPHQIQQYAQLRGYTGDAPAGHQQHRRQH